ncbi:MAG: M14 family metallopeptidase, partial [Thermomicrobiales bacterium]
AVLREERWELPWEVDDVRRLLRDKMLPRVLPGSRVTVDVRVSESREVRTALAEAIAGDIAAAGGLPDVKVRAVHKSGLAWLLEEVAPRIGSNVDRLEIRCRRFALDAAEWISADAINELRLVDPARADALQARVDAEGRGSLWREPPIRWLLELYPADELLPLPPERIRFDLTDDAPAAYEAVLLDAAGVVLDRLTFDPRIAARPFLDAFPDLGIVHPATGWVTAAIDGATVIDERVATDAERIWDRYQSEVLPALLGHARDVSGGAVDAASEPFFSAVEIEIDVSEPDEELPVREERSSPLEALHEDLYFVTLDAFRELGRREGGAPLDAPGQVIPWLRERPGQGASVIWRLLDAPRDPAHRPLAAAAARVTEVVLDDTGDAAACRIEIALPDRVVLPAALAALERVDGRVAVAARCEIVVNGETIAAVDLRQRERHETNQAGSGRDRRLRRDEVVGHDDHLDLLDAVAALPGVRLWRAGRSVQGRAIWAAEATAPLPGRRSHAKVTGWKPTLLINARHHGNEPSSTLSALETVRRYATDPTWDAIRRRVNLVALPFENVDGGDLSWRMQREHPRWMLHAGRYNALGLEFRAAYGDPGHPSLESRALPRLWRRWLPDIVVDDHGFPSHEWVQPFAGYIPKWPAYWLPRGLVYVYLRSVDDPAYPDHPALAASVRALMEEETSREADIVAMNGRWAERYRTYAHAWMPETFPFEPYRSLLVYDATTPPTPGGSWGDWGTDFGTLRPDITSLSFVTEVADETAQGAYMDACVRAHEAIDLACLRVLAESDHRLERQVQFHAGGCSRALIRRRPVAPRDRRE